MYTNVWREHLQTEEICMFEARMSYIDQSYKHGFSVHALKYE